jgi:ATP-dependent helicase/nuclease subunit B
MAELTRCALRTVAFNWRHEDWFGVLKTGLVPVDVDEVDRLENEALARGWEGRFWREEGSANPGRDASNHRLRQRLIAPFLEFETRIQGDLPRSSKAPDGRVLAQAIGALWSSLRVEEQLAGWSGRALEDGAPEQAAVHDGVWNQMQQWLKNLATAFAAERFDLSEWLAVMESGLSGLTVGVIPPSLDQVLIGAVDRSRNPDLKLALVLGMNEGRFPAPPPLNLMLTDPERERLALDHGLSLGPDSRQRLGHERYYGYIACTRARHRLILTFARSDDKGRPQNPSVFLTHLSSLFPGLSVQAGGRILDWADCEHTCELAGVLARRLGGAAATEPCDLEAVQTIPEIASLMKRLRETGTPAPDNLSPGLAEQLYGPALQTSVSRLEQFAACPFKFFVHSGMRAEERELFEADVRTQGSFQHEVLAKFHASVRDEGREWRDLTPREARERVTDIGRGLPATFGGGVLGARPESEFLAERLTDILADFIEVQVRWMRHYQFNPREAELTFGIDGNGLPGWRFELGEGHELLFRGKIDRVDLWNDPDAGEACCVVVDYKSGVLKLDEELMAAGVQLQLPAYLGVLRQLPEAASRFGVRRLHPAGVFYVSLRGQAASHRNRREALDRPEEIRAEAFRHSGRFDVNALDRLDSSGDKKGAQFNYRRKQDGSVARTSADPMESPAFGELLDRVERRMIEMGREIFAGVARVDPYQKGRKRPCDHCRYQAICRIDPWTHEYRGLGGD